ncbi:MAG: DUF4340 domain-containing protein [Verrucomicrobiales bacterium]|nr:DUF4340 domain-containing protein [Verrucomicrobiota bacterium JB025]
MNKRQVITLWVIAAVLGLAVITLKLAQTRSTDSATNRSIGDSLFGKFPATDATTIEIKGAAQTITLNKKDGAWTIAERDDYPANTNYVNSFLRDLAELKVTQALEAGPSFAPRFGLDPDASSAEKHGLIATFKDPSGKQIAKIGLGKSIEQKSSSANPMMMGGGTVGRYIRNFDDDSGFYAVNELFPSVSDEASRWLVSDFFSPEKITSVSLTDDATGKLAWKLTRKDEQAEFDIENAASDETVNTETANPLKSLFSYARFDDVVPAEEVENRAAKEGRQTVVIETAEGFTYTIGLIPEKETEDGEKPDTCLMTVDVEATLPTERNKPEGESEEAAKTADEAFAARLKQLTEKLESEKKLAGRTFVVSETTVAPVLKQRADLITKAEAPEQGESPQETGSVHTTPGGIVHTPPVKAPAPGKPVAAVTPPIAVPALPKEEETEEEITVPEPPLPDFETHAAKLPEKTDPPAQPATDQTPTETKTPEQTAAESKKAALRKISEMAREIDEEKQQIIPKKPQPAE